MRRLLPIAIFACLLLLPWTAAQAGPSQEFASEGFTWTLPDDWTFQPVSSAEKGAGFVTKAEPTNGSIEAWAYVKGTDGLDVMERAHELMQAGGEGMGTVTATKLADTTLSGVKGKVVIQRIQGEGGAIGHFRKYVVVSGGKFYQLLIRCWHDAHKDHKTELNELRAGFRLAKGAGPEDKPEPMDEVDGESGSAGGSSGGAQEGNWPPNGPKREGRTVFIPNHNLEWTLPEDSPFQWTGAIENGQAEKGLFVIAGARVKREKQEFEKGTPDENFARLDMIIEVAPPGFKAADWVRGVNHPNVPPARDIVGKKFWGLLDDVDAGKTRTNDEVKFGNYKAAYIKLEGSSAGKQRVVMLFTIVLRGKLYLVRAILGGHTDAYKQLAPLVGNAIGGIKFLNTEEDVRGPLLIDTVPDFAGPRGEDADKEKDYPGPGYVFEKPKGMASIKAKDSMNTDLQFAGEARSEDGKSYFYFEIRTYALNRPNTPNPDEEDIVEKRGQSWEAGAGENADLGSGKKLKTKKGSFGKGKGVTYRFTGELAGEPVVEEGWVVKHKSTLLFIKTQYIGANAEKDLKDMARDVKKGLKYSK